MSRSWGPGKPSRLGEGPTLVFPRLHWVGPDWRRETAPQEPFRGLLPYTVPRKKTHKCLTRGPGPTDQCRGTRWGPTPLSLSGTTETRNQRNIHCLWCRYQGP